MTLNQYKDLIRGYAVAHKNLNGRFFEGSADAFDNDKDQLYPVLLMYVEDTVVNEFEVIFKANFSVLDKVDTDRINRIEVQSDSELILRGLIAFLDNQSTISEVEFNINISHPDGVFNDDVAGATMDLSAHTFDVVNVCTVPFDSPPVGPVQGVYIRDKNTLDVLATLYPGQYYDVEVLRQIIDTITNNTSTIIEPLN